MTNSREFNRTYDLYQEVLKGTDFIDSFDLNSYIPYSDDMTNLSQKLTIDTKTFANRIEYQPMEGQDAKSDGSPSELTYNRYKYLARGGSALIWLEAVATEESGKSNPYQLKITENNIDKFKKLVLEIKFECMKENGFEPVVLMQITHSGRYSKPKGISQPIAAYFNCDIDKNEINLATDEFLKSLPDKFEKSAKLAEKAGFDGVDLKCCHGYLLSELLSAYDRQGIYGGSFENRTRALFECAEAINSALSKNMLRTSRINAYDGYLGKYCFGKPQNENELYDLTEVNKIIKKLSVMNFSIINVTMGSPYRNPDVSRPYKNGIDKPKSDAIFSLSRLFKGAYEIKLENKNTKIINTGISLLGSLSPFAAAGLLAEEMTDFVGFGRMSFAYPDLARDIISGNFNPKKCCVACSGCSNLKKNILKSGCIIHNEFYKNIYREFLGKV